MSDPYRSPPAPESSWKRGLKHAAITLFVVIGLGAAASMVIEVADYEKMGRGVGQFAAFASAIAWGVSYLAQTGRGRLAVAVALGVAGLVVAVTAALVIGIPRSAPLPPLTDGERATPLSQEQDGRRWLVHPTLGFRALDPGPGFQLNPEMAAVFVQPELRDHMQA